MPPKFDDRCQLAVVLHNYKPKGEDELPLTNGEFIHILSIDPNESGSEGWWVGQDAHSQIGVFPANYVQANFNLPEATTPDELHSEDWTSSFLDATNSSLFQPKEPVPAAPDGLQQRMHHKSTGLPPELFDSARGTSSMTGDRSSYEDSTKQEPSDDGVRLRRPQEHTPQQLTDKTDLKIIPHDAVEQCESIGAGSFGTVYRGHWLDKVVALKVYHQITNQIHKEASNLGLLKHPNIVVFYGIWFSNLECNLPALVMEFADGGALNSIVKRRPHMYSATLTNWCAQIACGMRYLHEEAGLVHRDLKTANILIKEPLTHPVDAEDLREKTLLITDFGMSCSTDTSESRTSGVGTAAYAAPEVIRTEFFTLASDVWSYGVVVWELMTMMEPFKEYERHQQMINIGRNKKKLFLPNDESGFPDAIIRLLNSCWSEEPGDRPTFSEIVTQLADFFSNDAFCSLSIDDFTCLQDHWHRAITEESESKILSEYWSSGTSSSLQTQNDILHKYLARLKARMLHNEKIFRETIAGLQKDNQILSVLVANSLYTNSNNTATNDTGKNNTSNVQRRPPPRKKPFARSLFNRNQQQSHHNIQSTVAEVDVGHFSPFSLSRAPRRGSNRRFKSKVEKNNRTTGADGTQKPSNSTANTTTTSPPYISPPSQMRHVVHVPSELMFDQVAADSFQMHSPGFYSASPMSTDNHFDDLSATPSEPVLHPPQDLLSPTGTEEILRRVAKEFAFLSLHYPEALAARQLNLDGSGSSGMGQNNNGNTARLSSYKSAPDLCSKSDCNSKPNKLADRHTVSRGSAIIPTGRKTKTRTAIASLFRKQRRTSIQDASQTTDSGEQYSNLSLDRPPQLPAGITATPIATKTGNRNPESGRKMSLHRFWQNSLQRRSRRIESKDGIVKTPGATTRRNRLSGSRKKGKQTLHEVRQQQKQPNDETEEGEEALEGVEPDDYSLPVSPPGTLNQRFFSPNPLTPSQRMTIKEILISPQPLSKCFRSPFDSFDDGYTPDDDDGSILVPRKSKSMDVLFDASTPPPRVLKCPIEMPHKPGFPEILSTGIVGLVLWSAFRIASVVPLALAGPPEKSADENEEEEKNSHASLLTIHQASFDKSSSFRTTSCNRVTFSTVSGGKKVVRERPVFPHSLFNRSRPLTRQWTTPTPRELSAPCCNSSPIEQWKLNHPACFLAPHISSFDPPPLDVSGCDTGGSEPFPFDSFETQSIEDIFLLNWQRSRLSSSPHSSSPSWLAMDNPVAASRDAYLKVTQDGYLNRSAGDGSFEDDHDEDHLHSPILLQTVGGSGDVCPCDHFFSRHEDDDQFDSFGAGEAAEDTATLYAADFQPPGDSSTNSVNSRCYQPVYPESFYDHRSLPNHGNSSTHTSQIESAFFLDGTSSTLPHQFDSSSSEVVDLGVPISSFPCRRREAFRRKPIVNMTNHGVSKACQLSPLPLNRND